MLELSRRKTLEWLNHRYIYGRIPLLHTLVFLIELAMIGRLIHKFNSYYATRPLATTCLVNAVLGGIADTVAQGIGAYRTRQLALPTIDTRSFISSGVEMDDYNEKPARLSPALSPSYSGPPPFDFERLTRFMSYAFLMTPLQFFWFGRLHKWFPITPSRATVPALQRVAMDQLLFAPVGISAFFTFMTIAEGGGKKHIIKKFQDIYIPTLKANYMLWPAVQMINFRLMPLQFHIPFVSTVGVAWTAYLSLKNSNEDDAMEV